MTIDGQRQRRALTAVEQALRALEAGDGVRAGIAAAEAAALDQVGAYRGFVDAVAVGIGDLEIGGEVTAPSWATIAAVLGPGPLGSWAGTRGSS